MKLNGRVRRMDSLMIESNIRFLSRMELIYTCISKLVVYLTKRQPNIISEQLKHYSDARAVRMIQDILHHKEPKRRYVNHPFECPTSYQAILSRYETLMKNDQKSCGTIRTRSGRMKVFLVFLAGRECVVLQNLTPELFTDYVFSLNDRYSSQGKASLLYTIRNFFSYNGFSEMLMFDPFPFLRGIHSRKHERLPMSLSYHG